jgi:hypothetical protein
MTVMHARARAHLTIAILAFALLPLGACSSTGDQPADAGAGDASPALDAQAAVACGADPDCTTAYYDHPISATADCTCPTCASAPVNIGTEAAYESEWQRFCASYAATAHCPALPCVAPPAVACLDGLCRTVPRQN